MRAGIQADDLTGACDAGATFAARGLATVVLLPEAGPPPSGVEVLVLDTESRDAPATDAGVLASAGVSRLAAAGPRWVFKKVDSTLRGALAAEVDGALSGSGAVVALLAPAFPGQGRTVRDSTLRIGGRDADLTPLARDPAFPSTGASVLALVGRDGPHPVGALTLETVRAPASLATRMDHAIDTGVRVLVADAETDDDLEALVAAAEGRPVILAGAAGLARALAGRLIPGASLAGPPRVAAPLLVVAGSAHPVTREQVARLRTRAFGSAGEGPDPLDTGLALVSAPPPSGAEPPAARLATVRGLADEARRRLEQGWPAATLVLTGGETAAAVCRVLGACGVDLSGELAPGLATGRLLGGPWAGLAVVTKAGGFGDPETLVRLFEGSA